MRAGHSHYEVLNVARDASPDDLRSAYRRLLRTCHPDVGGSPALFDLVNEAFCVLSDSAQRARYDAGQPAPAAEAPHPRTASHDGNTYASLRRARSSTWQPQPGTAYAPASKPRLVTLFI